MATDYVVIGLFIAIFIIALLYSSREKLLKRVEELEFKLRSKSIMHGNAMEKFAPFLKEWEYDKNKTHFIGQPIDYVVFQNDGIFFVEIKSGSAHLNENELIVKQNILNKKVYYKELRI